MGHGGNAHDSQTNFDHHRVRFARLDVNATDLAGNAAQLTNSYSVQYLFVGFLPPVDNLPKTNVGRAGRTYSIKWQLKDYNGAFITTLGMFVSLLTSPLACDAAPTTILEEETTTTGGTELRYDAASNQFIYSWKTTNSWTGCRLLQLTLSDGTRHYAKFKF